MNIALIYLGRSFPPIGLVQLCSYVSYHRPFVNIRIIDTNFTDPFEAQGSDIIGISSMTAEIRDAVRLSKRLREISPNSIQILGGVHISTLPELPDSFDYGCVGEGELVLLDLIDGKPCSQLIHNKPISLNDYPKLNYNYLHPQHFEPIYSLGWDQIVRVGVLFTSRGCPFKCVFCSTSAFWKGVRFFPVEWVRREIEDYKNRGIGHIEVWDDLFALNPTRIRAFKVDGMLYSCQAEASSFNSKIASAMKEIGVHAIGFGFESGNDRVLKSLKGDRASVRKNLEAIRLAKDFRVFGSVMIGSPTETFMEIMDTLQFVRRAYRIGVIEILMFFAHPYPGTKWWNGKISMIKRFPFQKPLLTDLSWIKVQIAFLMIYLIIFPRKLMRFLRTKLC